MRAVFFVLLALLIIVPIGVNDVFANDGKNILEIESLEYSDTRGRHNSLVQIDSDTYAVAYAGFGNDGFISTFTISSDGKTITKLATLEHAPYQGQYNSLVQVDSDTYALAYAGGDDDGWITTFTIPANGATITKEKTLEHDVIKAQYNSLVQVDSDTYALAYAGGGDDGYISTFTIDSDTGDITPILIQNHAVKGGSANFEHDEIKGVHNSLVQVDSDTYALAYSGQVDDGYISTFTI